jgi:FkbM family methyltransferase
MDLWLTGNRNFIYNEQTEKIISRVLEVDSNSVDVGTHRGEILETIVKVAPKGKHFAFEPIPNLCEELRNCFPQAEIYNLALSDHAGEETFIHVLTNPGYSGLRKRQYQYDEKLEEWAVKTARLDDVIPESVKISFIKIDVEGAELQVLRGAENVLKRDHPVIVFEHEPGGALSYGTKPEQVYSFLQNCGLRISLMHDWLEGNAPITKEEFARQFLARKNYCFVAHGQGVTAPDARRKA